MKKKKKQILALLMSLVMVFGTAVSVYAAEETDSSVADSEDITILYTNDVHTYINKSITYSLVAGYRDTLQNVLLVDAGDHIQGTAYGGLDNGATIVKLMNAAGYDLATLGNHEFDYGMKGALDTIKNADYPYVSCNFYHEENGVKGENVLDSYEIFEVNGVKIAMIGITTPESFTKSTPAYFQDGNGNYIYGIAGGTDGQALYSSVQTAIDGAKKDGADIVIALGHLGVDESSSPWMSTDVIANTTGLDAFIDGHSHSTVESQAVKDKEGNTVLLTQTGCYLSTLGQMTISVENGYSISTELLTADDLTEVTPDAEVKEIEDAWVGSVDEQLGQPIAESDIYFTTNDADGNRLVRKGETNLGDLNADAYYWYANEVANIDCDVAIMNGGGIRASVDAGIWTYKTTKTVNTFGNVLCVVEVTGQNILDALEFGARFTPDSENGGFLHTAGLTYKVDTSVENTVKVDDKNVWLAGPDEYRVYDVKVYNKGTGKYEPLELDKTYRMAGTNYTLRNCGDGFNMFGDSYLVLEGIAEDYLAMAAYVSAFEDADDDGLANIASENSPLAGYDEYPLDYENPSGSGRIYIANEKYYNYIVVDGEDSEWTTGSEEGLTIQTNAGDSAVKEVYMEVDGERELLDSSNYDVNNGVITLKSDYLATLKANTYKVVIQYADGEAEATFEITEAKSEEPGTEEPGAEEPGTGEPGTEEPGAEEPGTEEPGTEEPGAEKPGVETPEEKITAQGDADTGANGAGTASGTKAASTTSKAAKTGDPSDMSLYLMLLLAAGGSAVIVASKKRQAE